MGFRPATVVRLLLVGSLIANCGDPNHDSVEPEASPGPQFDEFTANFDRNSEETCGLHAFAAAPMLVEISDVTEPVAEPLFRWTGERTADELAALKNEFGSRLSVSVRATVKPILVRAEVEGMNPLDPVPEGSNVRVLLTPALVAGGLPLPEASRAIGHAVRTEEGAAFQALALLTSADPMPYSGACDWMLGPQLQRAAEAVTGGDVGSLVERLVIDYFIDGEFSEAIDTAATPEVAEFDPDAYERGWWSTPLDQRAVQVGAIPASLKGSVLVTGLWIDAAGGTEVDPLSIVVWSDLGISYEASFVGWVGAQPLVVPVEGEVRVSIRRADGTLSEPLLALPLPLKPDEGLALTVRGIDMTLQTVSLARFAELMGSSVEDIEALRSGYEAILIRSHL